MHYSHSRAAEQKAGAEAVSAVVSADRNYIHICALLFCRHFHIHFCYHFHNHFRIRYYNSKVTIKSKYSSYKNTPFFLYIRV